MNLKRNNNYNSSFSFIYTFEFCGVKHVTYLQLIFTEVWKLYNKTRSV